MKYTVIAYFDKDTEKFNPPFLVPMVLEDAIETIVDGVKKGRIEGAKSFDAFLLGYYDTANALFDLEKEPKKLLDLSSYVKD